jgi:hypothetical protein
VDNPKGFPIFVAAAKLHYKLSKDMAKAQNSDSSTLSLDNFMHA